MTRRQVNPLPWLVLLVVLCGGAWFAVRTIRLAIQYGFPEWLLDTVTGIVSFVIIMGVAIAAILYNIPGRRSDGR